MPLSYETKPQSWRLGEVSLDNGPGQSLGIIIFSFFCLPPIYSPVIRFCFLNPVANHVLTTRFLQWFKGIQHLEKQREKDSNLNIHGLKQVMAGTPRVSLIVNHLRRLIPNSVIASDVEMWCSTPPQLWLNPA